jgi:hypothetical protein
MKYWIIVIVLAISIIPFALKADTVDKMLFSNKKYAKQIEVKTYILTQEQVAELFKNPDKEPKLLTSEELNVIANEKRYCIFRVKNLGELHAWGKLSCKIPGINGEIFLEIPCIRKSYYCDYLICISGVYVSSGKDYQYPVITYKWAELNTK